MKKTTTSAFSTVILILLAVAYFYIDNHSSSSAGKAPKTEQSSSQHSVSKSNHSTVNRYYENRESGKMIKITAEVSRLLSDDTHEPRHQRFIIELDNGLTVLIAHNIDLAPRVEQLMVGDKVTITGQYEWNQRGGVIHWTHHDPRGNRDGGQIEHKNVIYR